MYAWELQNRAVCYIYVVRTSERPVVGFCAFWLVVDEIHINNVAVLPELRGQGIGTALMRRVFDEAHTLGARRATLEVRASNECMSPKFGIDFGKGSCADLKVSAPHPGRLNGKHGAAAWLNAPAKCKTGDLSAARFSDLILSQDVMRLP